MKVSIGLGALALASYAQAHTLVYSVWVNGADQGDGRSVYVRSPPSNYPVKDVSLPDIACNVNGGSPVSQFVSAAAGDEIQVEWYHDSRGDDIIASSHKGPVQAYITEYTDSDGSGSDWTKIASEGYDSGSDIWAVDNLISSGGKATVTIPSSLAAGKYLLRHEIIGLHEGDAVYSENPIRGTQFYPACIQLEVTEGGSATPPGGVTFPGGYTETDPGIHFNLYQCVDESTGEASYGCFGEYTAPGPEVWTG
ncbi:hypothetical protein FQN54_004652 [Arachnomyces sp. PD_36]|nr:hypothetical protein FQN54_004652 [Arachnomyces sp. PD_36]